MTDDLWGVGPDARRAARPVVLCSALGVAAFAVTFSIALLLGRGLSGSALAALLLPLALSGALAVGLAVAFVVAVALEQPYGSGLIRRLAPIVTPLAALVALFAYAADPAGNAGRPVTDAAPAPTVILEPPRRPPVSVPADEGTVVLGTRTRAPREPETGGGRVVAGPVVPQPAPRVRPADRPHVVTPDATPPKLAPSLPGKRVLETAGTPCRKAAKRGRSHCHSRRWRR